VNLNKKGTPQKVCLFYSRNSAKAGQFTLLLHKDPVELTGYHHKKSVSSILMNSSKHHHLVNPADDIALRGVP